MSKLVAPHGGTSLKSLLIPEAERAGEQRRAGSLTKVPMTSRETSDVIMMAMAAYTLLDGFMGEADWRGVGIRLRFPRAGRGSGPRSRRRSGCPGS